MLRTICIGTVTLAIVLGASLYGWATEGFVYSVGERVGFARKVAESGSVCDAYKGNLVMNSTEAGAGTTFGFNVRDVAVAKELDALAGHRVVVHYEQHKGVASICFGGEYLVTRVQRID